MEIKKYKNDDITVNWEPAKCIHSTNCFKGLLRVFNPNKKPWITLENSNTQTIIDQVNKCPSRALTFDYNKEESKIESVTGEQNNLLKIKISKAGPLLLHGSFIIEKDNQETIVNQNVTALCRCGQSQNKPYCDGSHRTINFDNE